MVIGLHTKVEMLHEMIRSGCKRLREQWLWYKKPVKKKKKTSNKKEDVSEDYGNQIY